LTGAQLVVAGRWLLVVGLLAPGTAFLVASIVAHVSGPATLGYAEACRQVAQPLLVFATGLSTVIGPRLTAAAHERSAGRARRNARAFLLLMALVGIPYLLIAGQTGRWNPLATLLPNAYAIPGLVLATLAANVLNGLNFSQRAELLGAGQARTLARVEVAGNVMRMGVAAMAGALQSFAIPVGLIVLGIVRVIGYSRNLKRHYGAAPTIIPSSLR
jgi:O-antigen/teichoic acid export membrane protein